MDGTPFPAPSWQAHSGEILSVELVMHDTQPLIVSASADCSVRLWSTKGHYVGTFGQVMCEARSEIGQLNTNIMYIIDVME